MVILMAFSGQAAVWFAPSGHCLFEETRPVVLQKCPRVLGLFAIFCFAVDSWPLNNTAGSWGPPSAGRLRISCSWPPGPGCCHPRAPPAGDPASSGGGAGRPVWRPQTVLPGRAPLCRTVPPPAFHVCFPHL